MVKQPTFKNLFLYYFHQLQNIGLLVTRMLYRVQFLKKIKIIIIIIIIMNVYIYIYIYIYFFFNYICLFPSFSLTSFYAIQG